WLPSSVRAPVPRSTSTRATSERLPAGGAAQSPAGRAGLATGTAVMDEPQPAAISRRRVRTAGILLDLGPFASNGAAERPERGRDEGEAGQRHEGRQDHEQDPALERPEREAQRRRRDARQRGPGERGPAGALRELILGEVGVASQVAREQAAEHDE